MATLHPTAVSPPATGPCGRTRVPMARGWVWKQDWLGTAGQGTTSYSLRTVFTLEVGGKQYLLYMCT